jgi:hypothetical protein
MGLRQFFKDFDEANRTSLPHMRSANATQEKIIALLREVEAKDSGLTPEEKSGRRQEIDELWEQLRGERRAARQPGDDLKAHYPRWVK